MSARNAGEKLTFLGARREEPCEERTEDASSVMLCGVQAVLQCASVVGPSGRSRRLLWAVVVMMLGSAFRFPT